MDDRANHIIEVTIRLLADEGLGVPTARVAREAGIANGTLFNLFPTKQALFDAVYLRLKGEMVALLGAQDAGAADLSGSLQSAWRGYIRWGLSQPKRHRAMKLLKGGGAVSAEVIVEAEQLFGDTARVVEAEMAAGVLRSIGFDHFSRLAEADADVAISMALERQLPDGAVERLIDNGFVVLMNGLLART